MKNRVLLVLVDKEWWKLTFVTYITVWMATLIIAFAKYYNTHGYLNLVFCLHSYNTLNPVRLFVGFPTVLITRIVLTVFFKTR